MPKYMLSLHDNPAAFANVSPDHLGPGGLLRPRTPRGARRSGENAHRRLGPRITRITRIGF